MNYRTSVWIPQSMAQDSQDYLESYLNTVFLLPIQLHNVFNMLELRYILS